MRLHVSAHSSFNFMEEHGSSEKKCMEDEIFAKIKQNHTKRLHVQMSINFEEP